MNHRLTSTICGVNAAMNIGAMLALLLVWAGVDKAAMGFQLDRPEQTALMLDQLMVFLGVVALANAAGAIAVALHDRRTRPHEACLACLCKEDHLCEDGYCEDCHDAITGGHPKGRTCKHCKGGGMPLCTDGYCLSCHLNPSLHGNVDGCLASMGRRALEAEARRSK